MIKNFLNTKNMKRNILIGILVCLCYWSCYEDKGVYDYSPSNGVTISTPPVNVVLPAVMGDTFRYFPPITFANPDDTLGFEYWWEYRGSTSKPQLTLDVVCNTRELSFLPRVLGTQTLQICVKEISTGIITSRALTVSAGTVYTKGWLILSEDDGESILSFVRPDRPVSGNFTRENRVYVPYVNLYNRIFPGESLGKNPIALRQAVSRVSGTIFYVIQENESVCLNGQSYQKEIPLAQEFIDGAPAGFNPRDYWHGNYSNIVLDADGKIYSRSPATGGGTAFFTYSFANFPVEYQGKVLKVDRIIYAMAETGLLFAVYDKENKRFLWVYAGGPRTAGTLMKTSYNVDGNLNYNDTGDADIIYAAYSYERSGQLGAGATSNLMVLYSSGGETYVQIATSTIAQNLVTLPVAGLPLTAVQKKIFSGKTYITPNTKYYKLKTRDYLFFATGGTVYWYDFATNETYAFFNFAGDEVIDMSSNPQESELGVLLKSGKFATLDILNENLKGANNPVGATNKMYEVDIPGNKMIDLEYKFPDYTQYTARTNSGSRD